MKEIWFFPNGNVAVTEDGKQIPEFQESWLILFVNFLESKGIDPTDAIYHLGSEEVEVFKTSDGYNWRIRNER